MNEASRLIDELRTLAGKPDQQSRKRVDEIAEWFSRNKTEENVALLNDFIDKGIEFMEAEVEDLKKCIQEELDKQKGS